MDDASGKLRERSPSDPARPRRPPGRAAATRTNVYGEMLVCDRIYQRADIAWFASHRTPPTARRALCVLLSLLT